jgi:2-polyprenyl-3-methyl-5-hydroxy-6-metoxy-1,4-benzoquinol methylase
LKTTQSTPLVTYANCPLCNSQNISKVLKAKDYTVSHETFEVWNCSDCQARFTQGVPVESEIGRYYQSEDYISHSNTQKGLVSRLYQSVRSYTLRQKRNWVKKVSGLATGRILDIGCGTGEFLNAMKGAGWHTLGLEPDEGARQMARKNYGLEVQQQDQLFELEEEAFDVISMWHVLEHVHRLHPYLDKIAKLLKAEGVLIIAVPNYQSKDADTYGKEWAAYDVPRHLYHFSPAAMEQLLESHGFQLVQKKLMPFDPFYVSLLSEKYRHGSARLLPAFWNGALSLMKSMGNVDQASSVIYLARKK